MLRDFGRAEDRAELLRRVTLNVVIGNGDAHAKNFSVLHPQGADGIQLAPAYDLIATVALEPVDERGRRIAPDRRLGQRVGGASFVDEVTRDHLLAEAATWGIRLSAAGEIVGEMLARVGAASMEDQWLERVVHSNLKRLGSGS